jgi:hypothetical protein
MMPATGISCLMVYSDFADELTQGRLVTFISLDIDLRIFYFNIVKDTESDMT